MSGASNEFGLDAGFGERNSLGFGFMDVRNHFSGARENHKHAMPIKRNATHIIKPNIASA